MVKISIYESKGDPMARPKHQAIEYRNYLLPAYFPIILLAGDMWRISDVPSGTLHFHNCLEIGICESDSGTLEFSDSKQPFKAGDVTIIGNDIAHTTYSTKGTKSKWSYIFVNIEELLASYFPLELISGRSNLRELLHNCTAILPKDDYPEIYYLTDAIIKEMQGKKNNFQFTVRGLVLAFAMKLLNIYEKNENVRQMTTQDNSLAIAPALTFIRENFAEDYPMEDLADLCHMSPTHFRRVFSGIMGFGALEYTNRLRIDKASALLRTTEMPVLDISEEVGFHSVSSFNRHFNEIIGMTPMQYRRQMSCVRDKSVLRCTGWMVPPT